MIPDINLAQLETVIIDSICSVCSKQWKEYTIKTPYLLQYFPNYETKTFIRTCNECEHKIKYNIEPFNNRFER